MNYFFFEDLGVVEVPFLGFGPAVSTLRLDPDIVFVGDEGVEVLVALAPSVLSSLMFFIDVDLKGGDGDFLGEPKASSSDEVLDCNFSFELE